MNCNKGARRLQRDLDSLSERIGMQQIGACCRKIGACSFWSEDSLIKVPLKWSRLMCRRFWLRWTENKICMFNKQFGMSRQVGYLLLRKLQFWKGQVSTFEIQCVWSQCRWEDVITVTFFAALFTEFSLGRRGYLVKRDCIRSDFSPVFSRIKDYFVDVYKIMGWSDWVRSSFSLAKNLELGGLRLRWKNSYF